MITERLRQIGLLAKAKKKILPDLPPVGGQKSFSPKPPLEMPQVQPFITPRVHLDNTHISVEDLPISSLFVSKRKRRKPVREPSSDKGNDISFS